MIRKIGICIFGLLLFTAAFVRAARAEQISLFAADISIAKDGSVTVAENITYDFGNLERHGIFRTIPIKYERNGGTYKLRISNVDVTNGEGTDIPFTLSYPGDNLEIKIGDPDRTITGVRVYRIQYTAKRAINFFPDHDELYWNVTGEGWNVPILAAKALVSLEGAEDVRAACFIGPRGSTAPCNMSRAASLAAFDAGKTVSPGEGLTVVYGFPKGLVPEPTRKDAVKYFLLDNGVLGLPLIILVLMFYVWRKYGRDPIGRGTIVPEYDAPQGLTPLQLGILVDESVHPRDISAEIIYLATKGYFTITREEKKKFLIFPANDYRLTKLKDAGNELERFDKKLLTMLFGSDQEVWLSGLKGKRAAFTELQQAKKDVYEDLVSKKYFVRNPNTVKALWVIGGIVAGLLLVFGLSAFAPEGVAIVSGVLSGLILVIFGIFMPARTQKGVAAREHALGLKEYITVAEKDRLAFHNDPAKNPQRFEAILPFAIALGVDKAWAKIFEGISMQPSWYSDPSHMAFNSLVFANALGDFSSSVQAVAPASSAGSGGSGFSGGGGGGGFGGGGGGSW